MTPADFQNHLRALADPKAANRAVRNGLRRAASRGVTRARKNFSKRGIGRRIFGKNRSGLTKLVTVGRPESGALAEASIEIKVKGIPGLMEEGGRTKPHRIKARSGSRLAFRTRTGQLVRPAEVKHPGSRVPKTPGVEPELERISRDGQAEIQKGMDALIARGAR